MSTDGLRERKKAATRAALSAAALRMTMERGLDRLRVEDIAAGAGVSPRTFNNYFSRKEEAVVGNTSRRCVRKSSRPNSLGQQTLAQEIATRTGATGDRGLHARVAAATVVAVVQSALDHWLEAPKGTAFSQTLSATFDLVTR